MIDIHSSQQPDHGHGELLDTRQAAARCGMSPGTWKNWRAEGTGPAYIRCGRSIRYSAADVDAWLAAQRIDSGQVGA